MATSSVTNLRPFQRALISVTDKSGIVDLCRQLFPLQALLSTRNEFSNHREKEPLELLSTGGTCSHLRKHQIPVKEVSEVTGFPEILDGQIKTLHPKIHAGLLSNRSNASHQNSMRNLGLQYIDLVVINLYEFERYSSEMPQNIQTELPLNSSLLNAVKYIDIGGAAILRAAAKNFHDVICISSINQYPRLINELTIHGGCTSLEFRIHLAMEAFSYTSRYDSAIAHYLKLWAPDQAPNVSNSVATPITESPQCIPLEPPSSDQKDIPPSELLLEPSRASASSEPTGRRCLSVSGLTGANDIAQWIELHQSKPIRCSHLLKYGLNPHQQPSCFYLPYSSVEPSTPFVILNGCPGYINLLDAINAWQLVTELSNAIEGNPPVAASFKHVSPAGVALGKEQITLSEANHFDLPDALRERLGVGCTEDSHSATKCYKKSHSVAAAIIRARNCDPLCSFGDLIAVSAEVDQSAALFLKTEVSDGIIAPAFTAEALRTLCTKKSGRFLVLQGRKDYIPPPMEYREVYGIGLIQKRNDVDPLGQFKVVTPDKKTEVNGSAMIAMLDGYNRQMCWKE